MRTRAISSFMLAGAIALFCGAPSAAQNASLSTAKDCAENAVPQPVVAHGAKRDGYLYASVCVRPYKPDPEYAKHQTPAGETRDGLSLRNWDLAAFVHMAYGAGIGKLFGAPDWLSGNNAYDLEAKMDPATADALEKLNPDERKIARQHMLQALLADEFKLQAHRETRTIPAYNLVVAEGGVKFHAVPSDPKRPDGMCMVMETGANATFHCGPGRIDWLQSELEFFMAQPVIDKTGLAGFYAFTLQFRTTPEAWVKTHPEEAKATLPVTLIDQLGLKLEPVMISTEVLVIDHIERPVAN